MANANVMIIKAGYRDGKIGMDMRDDYNDYAYSKAYEIGQLVARGIYRGGITESMASDRLRNLLEP